MRNNTKVFSLLPLLATLGLTGCSATGSFSVEHNNRTHETNVKLESKGTFGNRLPDNLIKPLASAMAYVGISSGDFNDFAPEEFYIRVTDSNASTSASGVVAKIFDGNYLIALKSFSVKKVGSDYFLADPQAFKNWAADYYDMGDRLDMTLKQTTVYYGSGSTTSSFYEGNTLLDQATASHTCLDQAGENQYFCTKN